MHLRAQAASRLPSGINNANLTSSRSNRSTSIPDIGWHMGWVRTWKVLLVPRVLQIWLCMLLHSTLIIPLPLKCVRVGVWLNILMCDLAI